jgi:hypothetical protein
MAAKSMTWTPEQTAVIQSAPHARLLVDAGPGTGKTATACARIAWLMRSANLEPTDIWLVSFTRTAVREIRNRIAAHCGGLDEIAGMRIATIDSHAWAIQTGFDGASIMLGEYEDNIQRVIELIQKHEGVFDYLSTIRHLVVDEAQDVVGSRCVLLLELIHALPADCGVSIFSDEAQAIYGFAEEDGDDDAAAIDGHLPDQIRQYMPNFETFDLSVVHRTGDPKLKKIFSDGRRVIRETRGNGTSRHAEVKRLVTSVNHGTVGLYREDVPKLAVDANDTFLLFRRRGEALSAAYYLDSRPHRFRMSGLPHCIDGRIAQLFWDWTEPFMDERTFLRRFRERAIAGEAAALWRSLVQLFGPSESRLSVTNMVVRLSASAPPLDVTMPDFGSMSGPIVGTIHGAKGREAADVRLYLPPDPWNPTDDKLSEEARLIFVGATRASRSLKIGQGATRIRAKRLKPSGRAYSPWNYGRARANVEVGRKSDIDAVGLVGRRYFATAREAEAAQQRAQMSTAIPVDLRAFGTSPENDWRYRMSLASDPTAGTICFLSDQLNTDLFSIGREAAELVRSRSRLPPSDFIDVRSYGSRTVTLVPSDPARELLHSPWRESGIIAAPMVLGYPLCFFR